MTEPQLPPAIDQRYTGPEAIEAALAALNLDELENEQREVIRLKKKTARPRAVRLLNVIQGLKKNQIQPKDLMIRQVPVIPPNFRPFSVTGDTFIPGDANEMYRDLMEYRRLYNEQEKTFGREAAAPVYGDMANAVRAAYGFGESPNPKIRSRSVKGFFDVVVGTNPKTSFYQSRMLAKPVDTVGRGVIIPDADLDMDEVGVPEETAWTLYANYVQRRLVTGGMSPGGALQNVKDRTPQARKAMEDELSKRPLVITRSPAWHKFNVIGQRPKLVKGDAIRINTFITDGQNADFDGDTMSVHVPSSPDAVKDVQERLMASNMLWSIKDRTKPMGAPKHEQIVGLSYGNEPGGQKRRFKTSQEAMEAIEAGQIDMNDDIEIGEKSFPQPIK